MMEMLLTDGNLLFTEVGTISVEEAAAAEAERKKKSGESGCIYRSTITCLMIVVIDYDTYYSFAATLLCPSS